MPRPMPNQNHHDKKSSIFHDFGLRNAVFSETISDEKRYTSIVARV